MYCHSTNKAYLLLGIAFYLLVGCNEKSNKKEAQSIPSLHFEVIERLPHNTAYFTQGLFFHPQTSSIWESTGQHSESYILSYTIDKSSITNEKKWIGLSGEYFGEGITILDDFVYQLTWKNHKLFVYDFARMQLQREIPINYEGWGITHDNTNLIISDGTSKLRWVNPVDFSEVKSLIVHDKLGSLDYINELELVDGDLYANRWQTNTIIKVDTATGEVIGELDVTFLTLEAKDKFPRADVANGIAYDAKRQLFFVTGKYWPYLYTLKINNNIQN